MLRCEIESLLAHWCNCFARPLRTRFQGRSAGDSAHWGVECFHQARVSAEHAAPKLL